MMGNVMEQLRKAGRGTFCVHDVNKSIFAFG